MKNVVVTGANKGIGFEVAKQMAEGGYFVYLGCRNEQNGLDAIDNLRKLNITNVGLLQLDVSDWASVKAAASELASKIDALDILINNAGVAGGQPQNISACEMSLLKEVFNTNYFGAIQTTQAMLP